MKKRVKLTVLVLASVAVMFYAGFILMAVTSS